MDGECLLSKEGTTQGDPLAMAMFAITIMPLTEHLNGMTKQIWYADDASAEGSLIQL